MVVGFGFSVGDVIAVGKLIATIVKELRRIGDAAPEYQELIIELNALKNAFDQLQDLRPAPHEVLKLDIIKDVALSSQTLLQEYRDKISKFDGKLSQPGPLGNPMKRFSRRVQWKLMYADDSKMLRERLTRLLMSMSFLLITQTKDTISKDAKESGHWRESLDHQIKTIRAGLEIGRRQMEGIKEAGIMDHKTIMARLEIQKRIGQSIQEDAAATRSVVRSTLAVTIHILSCIAKGSRTLKRQRQYFIKLLSLFQNLSQDMRDTMGRILQHINLQMETMTRLETALSEKVSLPTITFTDPFGDTMALPYQMCQQWDSFFTLLCATFHEKPGRWRVEMGSFVMKHKKGGRILTRKSWHLSVKQGDHIQMSMIIEELQVTQDICPFPSCRALLGPNLIEHGEQVCGSCGRHSKVLNLRDVQKTEPYLTPIDVEGVSMQTVAPPINCSNNFDNTNRRCPDDIELFRNIQVQENKKHQERTEPPIMNEVSEIVERSEIPERPKIAEHLVIIERPGTLELPDSVEASDPEAFWKYATPASNVAIQSSDSVANDILISPSLPAPGSTIRESIIEVENSFETQISDAVASNPLLCSPPHTVQRDEAVVEIEALRESCRTPTCLEEAREQQCAEQNLALTTFGPSYTRGPSHIAHKEEACDQVTESGDEFPTTYEDGRNGQARPPEHRCCEQPSASDDGNNKIDGDEDDDDEARQDPYDDEFEKLPHAFDDGDRAPTPTRFFEDMDDENGVSQDVFNDDDDDNDNDEFDGLGPPTPSTQLDHVQPTAWSRFKVPTVEGFLSIKGRLTRKIAALRVNQSRRESLSPKPEDENPSPSPENGTPPPLLERKHSSWLLKEQPMDGT